jgi:hypothetical protein
VIKIPIYWNFYPLHFGKSHPGIMCQVRKRTLEGPDKGLHRALTNCVTTEQGQIWGDVLQVQLQHSVEVTRKRLQEDGVTALLELCSVPQYIFWADNGQPWTAVWRIEIEVPLPALLETFLSLPKIKPRKPMRCNYVNSTQHILLALPHCQALCGSYRSHNK